jgi:hypothetical protein
MYGGGAYMAQASVLTIQNGTLAANMADSDQIIGDPDVGGSLTLAFATAYLTNTILAQEGAAYNCTVYGLDYRLHAGADNVATDGSCDQAWSTTQAALALGPLGNNGGSTPTAALLPNSAAIDNGAKAACPPDDQRGIARPQGFSCDAGAFESRGFTLAVAGGSGQSAPVRSVFPQPLIVAVTSPYSEPVEGGQVVFFAPTSGTSATLSPGAIGLIAGGMATVQAIANHRPGTYAVIAGAIGVRTGVALGLTNIALPYDLYLPGIIQGE